MIFEDFIVLLAEEAVVFEREFVAGRQLLVAHAAAEAVYVVDAVAGAHHEVVLVEAVLAFEAFLAE